jgi:hypothetical protein
MKIRDAFLVGALALAIPSAVLAQGMAPSGGGQMPPEVQQARDNAKTAAFNDLSADHRAKVQAIVDKFNSGSLSMQDAGTQIDGVLTPDESKSVLGEQEKFRDAMRQAFANGNGGNGGGPPGSGGGFHGGGMHGGGDRKPDAGRFLLMMSASQDALRNAMSSGQHP